jgi:hypothetical protein
MYIETVLSYLGAWENLQNNHPNLVEELEHSLALITEQDILKKSSNRSQPIDPRPVSALLSKGLQELGWAREVKLLTGRRRSIKNMSIDAIKEGFGLELVIGKRAFAESMLFTRFPLFQLAKRLHTAILLVPMESIAKLTNDPHPI